MQLLRDLTMDYSYGLVSWNEYYCLGADCIERLVFDIWACCGSLAVLTHRENRVDGASGPLPRGLEPSTSRQAYLNELRADAGCWKRKSVGRCGYEMSNLPNSGTPPTPN